MTRRHTLQFLDSRGNEVQGIHLGLHRIQALMRAFGNPHQNYPVLHIAGTNGKGSVAAMAEAILRQAGWKTGLFTSPHLEAIQERIRIGGREISTRRLLSLARRVRQKEAVLLRKQSIDRQLTYFEFITACAFIHFAEVEVDVAVIEVGLGGLLDATNVVHPRSCVITGVSYDHEALLGNTLTKIATEKAGIIKPGVPVVSGCRAPEARRVIRDRARRLKAPLVEIDRDQVIRITGEHRGYFSLSLQTAHLHYPHLRLSLAGEYQVRNAALAVIAVEALSSLPVSVAAVRRGLASTHWPGRLDLRRARRQTLLDGAHNPEGARLLRDHLRSQRRRKICLVFGAMKDKDLKRIGELVFPLAHRIHLAPVANSRSAHPQEMAALHERFRPRMELHSNARLALRAAWRECPRDGLVVVTGSLYLLGEILPLVRGNEKRG